jgi:energy-coupling factor transporter ATP-binding protein EcfA2
MDTPDLAGALRALRDRVAGLHLGLVTAGADAARAAQTELVGQVDDYLLPRLRRIDAPLLAVVGGSTGAGKSTLVNSLVGAVVSRAGWLRPTTRGPVLVCHPAGRRLVHRTTGCSRSSRARRGTPIQGGARHAARRPHPGVPAGLALIDAPDIDSVGRENRALATQLLAAADLWIFCTTAARYADAVPWVLLHTAQQRSTALAVVLNRVPPEGVGEISRHPRVDARRERARPGGAVRRPRVPAAGGECAPAGGERSALAGVDHRLAADADARAEVIRTTLDGALASLRQRVSAVRPRGRRPAGYRPRCLRDEADTAYADAALEVDDGVRSGSVLRGEVLARWQEFVGTGELTRGLEERIGRLRDRVTAFLLNREPPTAPVGQALESSVETLVRAAADGAAERTGGRLARQGGRAEHCWADRPRALARSSDDFRPALEREIRAWQGRVLQLVADEGRERRTAARLASFGTNGAGPRAHARGLRADRGPERASSCWSRAGPPPRARRCSRRSSVTALCGRSRRPPGPTCWSRSRTSSRTNGTASRFFVTAAAPTPDSALTLRAALEDFEQARRANRGSTRPGGRPLDVGAAR